ncbi:hypothetical protein Tco_1176365 [Tanacetum coccineum]
MAWTTSDTKYESVGISGTQELSPHDYLMQDDSIPEEQRKNELTWTIPSSNKSNVENNWASALATTYEPLAKNSLLAKTGDMTAFMKWYCRQFQMEECHKMLTNQVDWANPEGDQVRINVNRPLPLGGPPGHGTIQTQIFFNKDLEYLRYGSKGSCPALLISKMKSASYPDFSLELLVPEHDSPSRHKDVRTYMRILSVVRVKAYSRYWYDYLSEIVLRRADYQEHTIAKKDFKNLYPSDFEDLNLLLLQGHLNHLSGSDKRMLSTAVKLWTRNLFSNGTLTRILEALAYRVKEFKVNRFNLGMNTRFWTDKDVTRSNEFIKAIERRLKTRRIYQNLECFVGGRARNIDYRLL